MDQVDAAVTPPKLVTLKVRPETHRRVAVVAARHNQKLHAFADSLLDLGLKAWRQHRREAKRG